jgi:hypothetical protein
MAKNIRQLNGYSVQDPAAIDNLTYNPQAGARKVTDVGRRLIPIAIGASTWTTTPTAATALPMMGMNVAVYNNSGSVGTVTLGQASTLTSLAPGIINSSGQAGIPCQPNSWTYIACGMQNWIITSAATLFVFVIEDTSYIRQEVANYSNSNYPVEGGS